MTDSNLTQLRALAVISMLSACYKLAMMQNTLSDQVIQNTPDPQSGNLVGGQKPAKPAVLARTLCVLIPILLLFAWTMRTVRAQLHLVGLQENAGRGTKQIRDVIHLQPYRPMVNYLEPGVEQSYVVTVEKGQYLRVVVRQLGMEVLVTLLSPDGGLVEDAESSSDELTLECLGMVSGNYRLVVRGLKKSTASGRYEVKIDALLLPTDPGLKTRMSARELARALNEQGLPGVSRGEGTLEPYRFFVTLFGAAGNYGQILKLDLVALANKDRVDQSRIAQALSDLGNDHRSIGNHGEALEAFTRALAWSEATGDQQGMVCALNGLGIVYQRQHNPALALDRLHKSLALANTLSYDDGGRFIRHILLNLGVVYALQKDYGKALEFFQSSLSNFGYRIGAAEEDVDKSRGSEDVEILFNNIGFAYSDLGDYDQALRYMQRALAAREALKDTEGIIQTLNNIGGVYNRRKDHGKALEYFRRSLEIARDKQAKADTLQNIALTLLSQGNYPAALDYSGRALKLASEIALRRVVWEAHTIAGRAYDGLGQPEKACSEFEAAIRVIESIRADIPDQENRTTFFANVRDPYQLYIDLLMRQHEQNPSSGHHAKALEITERSRARALLEVLSEARADIRRGTDSELLRRERLLQSQLNRKAKQRTQLLSGQHALAQATSLKESIATVTAELSDLRRQIRLRSPRYASLTQPATLNIGEIQGLLDRDTVLLEYVLGDERSYLWAVTPTSVSSFRLPRRAEIEDSARVLYVVLSDGENWIRASTQTAVNYAKEAESLSRMLLGPTANQLKGKRLIIVADGVLQYLPFGALPSPSAQTSRPLIFDNEVVSLPSISSLTMIRRDNRTRATPSGSVAVLADPVFEANDERLTSPKKRTGGSSSSAKDRDNTTAFVRGLLERTRTPRERARGSGVTISRLPFTRREADAILALEPTSAGFKAVDFDASRETATSSRLSKYRYVHFATHGILDSEHPELSGIVLSLVDRTGKPVDGYLRLHEIFSLNLSADLVVLSGCQTALGKDIKGEGLIGLTRGFMYAGTPRVLSSLWKVNDVATAELMTRFYRGVLKEKLQPAAALRAAQIEMFKQKRWQSPHHWAAFQLQGDWK